MVEAGTGAAQQERVMVLGMGHELGWKQEQVWLQQERLVPQSLFSTSRYKTSSNSGDG